MTSSSATPSGESEPRCSPPAKLASPGLARPEHDVFALGAVCYRLLTGDYPWSVSTANDVGALREAMLNSPLRPAHEHQFDSEAECLAATGRSPPDERRLSAGHPHHVAEQVVRDELAKQASGSQRRAEYSHPYRDTVHGDIYLSSYGSRSSTLQRCSVSAGSASWGSRTTCTEAPPPLASAMPLAPCSRSKECFQASKRSWVFSVFGRTPFDRKFWLSCTMFPISPLVTRSRTSWGSL